MIRSYVEDKNIENHKKTKSKIGIFSRYDIS